MAHRPLNFEKLFSTGTVIGCRELLSSQRKDRCCRKLAKLARKQSDYILNHEGLLTKQINILRDTYRVYVVPQRLVQRVIKIFHDNRGHQGISRTINMMNICIHYLPTHRHRLWLYDNNLLYIRKYIMTDNVLLLNANVYDVLM